jgi:hypothetical protein
MLERAGFGDDVAAVDGGRPVSDRFLDALVVIGDPGEVCASVLRYRDARASSASRGSGRIAAGRKGWTPRLLTGLDRPAARGSGGNGGRDHRALQDVAKGVGRVLERCPAEADPHSLRMMSASSAEWSLRPSLRQAWW